MSHQYVNTKMLGEDTPYILLHKKGGMWNATTNVANVSTLQNHMEAIITVLNALMRGGDIALLGKEEARKVGKRKGKERTRVANAGSGKAQP